MEMTKTQDLIFGAIKSWIHDTPNLEDLAKTDARVHRDIYEGRKSQLRLARAIIGQDGMQELAGMDLRWLVDAVLNWDTNAGAILWRHEKWFVREMEALRKLFVGGESRWDNRAGVATTARKM